MAWSYNHHRSFRYRYRLLHRPHSLRQRITISADDSPELIKSMESIEAARAVLDQFAEDGTSNHVPTRTTFGFDSLEAETALFTHDSKRGPYKELHLPANIDPTGSMAITVHRHLFHHSEDNSVQYAETNSASTWRHVITLLSFVLILTNRSTGRMEIF